MKFSRMITLLVSLLFATSTVLTACGRFAPPAPVPASTPTVTNPPAQAESQSLPNMGQQITPLAPKGATFEMLNPDLVDNPNWLAGQAVTSVVSPDKKTMLVLTSGYNRVFRTDGKPDAFGTYFNWPDSQENVFVDEPERCSRQSHGRRLQHQAQPLDLYRRTCCDALQHEPAADPQACRSGRAFDDYDAAWWADATEDVDFTGEDKMDFASYSALVWRGLMGDRPYPTTHSGADLRLNRAEYLAKYEASLK